MVGSWNSEDLTKFGSVGASQFSLNLLHSTSRRESHPVRNAEDKPVTVSFLHNTVIPYQPTFP